MSEEVKAPQQWGHGKGRGTRKWTTVHVAQSTISVGDTFTIHHEDTAKVINVGTDENAIIDFYIPQGKPGTDATVTGFTFKSDDMIVEDGLIKFLTSGRERISGAISVESKQIVITGEVRNGQLLLKNNIEDMFKTLFTMESIPLLKRVIDLETLLQGDSSSHFRLYQHDTDISSLRMEIANLTKTVYELQNQLNKMSLAQNG